MDGGHLAQVVDPLDALAELLAGAAGDERRQRLELGGREDVARPLVRQRGGGAVTGRTLDQHDDRGTLRLAVVAQDAAGGEVDQQASFG